MYTCIIGSNARLRTILVLIRTGTTCAARTHTPNMFATPKRLEKQRETNGCAAAAAQIENAKRHRPKRFGTRAANTEQTNQF